VLRGVSPTLADSCCLLQKTKQTVFSPFLIVFFSMASTIASSVSNTLALPVNCNPSLPVILATAPFGARLPRKMLGNQGKSKHIFALRECGLLVLVAFGQPTECDL
jgi:hypothetical protein